MNREIEDTTRHGDTAPGDERGDVLRGVRGYLVGLALAAVLTTISFWVALDREMFWQPGVAIGLSVLAMAQTGIHLVFFLHLTTGPANVNNAMAVSFGALIVVLIGAGSLWIMANLNTNMMPMAPMTDLQRQR